MEQKFDAVSLSAMTQADAVLEHIAETERLDAAQTVRLIAKTSARLRDMQHTEHRSALPDIRKRKRHLRAAGILLAAAVSVSVLGIAVSGRMRYHKYVMERYFGLDGEARLAAMNLPEQETVSNGVISAAADAFLYDGHRAAALVTFDTADSEHPIDWLGMMQHHRENLLYYDCTVLDAEGNALGTETHPLTEQDPFWHVGSAVAWSGETGSITVELTFLMPAVPETDRITLRFSDAGYGTLDVPVQLGEMLKPVTLTDGSRELYLSPIGLTVNDRFGTDDGLFRLTLTDSSGRVRHAVLETVQSGMLPWSSHEDYTAGKLYEVTEGTEYKTGKPETYSAFMDVSAVISAEWDGTVFTAAE